MEKELKEQNEELKKNINNINYEIEKQIKKLQNAQKENSITRLKIKNEDIITALKKVQIKYNYTEN
tara:strand:- start:358 stop:555 length:198 start_codon:yes stop_codon:yes gene_type:complete